MKILILVHVETEGAGSLEDDLNSVGACFNIARLYQGERLPSCCSGLDGIVSMGGPMNVYEEDKYPFLREETVFLHEAIKSHLPVFGICLGAQLIAKALGARVTRSPVEEVGWGNVCLTEAGKTDPFFRNLPQTLEVLQWHGDMFHVPEGGMLLATGDRCPNQAFRYLNAVGLQFHLEVKEDMLRQWFADSPDIWPIMKRYGELEKDLKSLSEALYANFLELLERRMLQESTSVVPK